MSRSKLDPNQITQHVFDEENSAYRVNVLPYEMAIELNADDGDSVLTQKNMQVIQVQAGQVIDTSKVSRITVTVETTATAVILGQEISMGMIPMMTVKEICVPALKLSAACIVILQS